MAQQYKYENKAGDSWLRPKSLRVELNKPDFVPDYLIKTSGYVEKGPILTSFTHHPFALNVENTSDKHSTVLHRTNSSSRAPLNDYLFKILLNFQTELALPQDFIDKIKTAQKQLSQFDMSPYSVSGYVEETPILGPVYKNLYVQGFTKSLDPYYFERNDNNYLPNGEDIEKSLALFKSFFSLNKEIIEYAQKNAEEIEKVVGRMVIHSYVALEYRNNDYTAPGWKEKSKDYNLLPTTFVDNLVLVPEIRSSYYMENRIASTRYFKTEKDYQLFKKNRAQIEKDLSAFIQSAYDTNYKKRAPTHYVVKTEDEIKSYAVAEGIDKTDHIKSFFNTRSPEAKREIRVFAKTYFPFKKLVPHIPHLSKGFEEALSFHEEYSLKNREHQEKYGEKNLYFIFASPKEESKHASSGFFVNKRGTRLTLDIESAQSFASEDIAKNFFLKSDKASTHEGSYIKTQLKIQSFTGAQPTSNKEFVNFLSQWETEEIKKMFNAPKIVEPVVQAPLKNKKPNKI